MVVNLNHNTGYSHTLKRGAMSSKSIQKTDWSRNLRDIDKRDLKAVTEIERSLFAQPWTSREFSAAMRSVQGIVCPYTGSENREYIAGYVIYGVHKDHVWIHTMGVAASLQMLGIASSMLKEIQSLMTSKRHSILLLVSESNLHAQRFYRNRGFIAVRILPGIYKENSGPRDAYLMQYRPEGPTPDFIYNNRISELLP